MSAEGGEGEDRPLLAPLPWLVATVLWVTWSPFVTRPPAPPMLGLEGSSVAEAAANLALLAPAAFVFALRADGPWRRTFARTVAAAALLGLGIEAGQAFVVGRHVSPVDWLLNTLGAGAAALLAALLAPRFPRRALAAATVGLVYLALLGHLVHSAAATSTHRLALWDPAHLATVADEVGGGRAYEGSVREPSLCTGPPGRPLCVTPGDDGATHSRFVEEAIRTQTVRLEAEVWSATDRQVGPARIVSLSFGPFERNVTLAQEGRSLLLRVRTPLAGLNGTKVIFRLPAAVRREEWTRVSASYERGRVRLTAESDGRRRAGSFEPGLLTGWLLRSRAPLYVSLPEAVVDVDVRSGRRAVAASALVLFLPLGLLAGELWRRPGPAFIAAAAAAPLLLLGGGGLAGAGVPGFHLVCAAGFALAGTAMARRERSARRAAAVAREEAMRERAAASDVAGSQRARDMARRARGG